MYICEALVLVDLVEWDYSIFWTTPIEQDFNKMFSSPKHTALEYILFVHTSKRDDKTDYVPSFIFGLKSRLQLEWVVISVCGLFVNPVMNKNCVIASSVFFLVFIETAIQ